MAKIVTPAIRKTYKTLIKQVVEDLSKPIIAFLPPAKVDCPNCKYDFINKKSSGVFETSFSTPVTIFGNLISPITFNRGRCPVCFGAGQLVSAVTRNIKALVKWDPVGDLEILPVGREGSSVVRIKALRRELDNIMNAEYFVIDGVRCELNQPPTIRGLGKQEELVVAFLLSVEVGHEVKR